MMYRVRRFVCWLRGHDMSDFADPTQAWYCRRCGTMFSRADAVQWSMYPPGDAS